jgi:hypothetical protein
VTIQPAAHQEEWEQALTLVGQRYQQRGYDPAGTDRVHFTRFHALPDTVTYVAKDGHCVLATLSLISDNYLLGLPMELIYPDEIERLRHAGRRLVEVTSLAAEGLHQREFLPVFTALMRCAAQATVHQGAESLVITVNPRHRLFYTRCMGFVSLGPCRAYPEVQNYPAEPYLLDPELLRRNAPAMFTEIFGTWLPREMLAPYPIPPALVRELARRSSHADVPTANRVLDLLECLGSTRRW